MRASRAKKQNDRIAEFVNIKGRWTLPKFTYDSWLQIGERHINNGKFVDGYELLCFAHYCYGEMSEALPYSKKLAEISDSNEYKAFHYLLCHLNSCSQNGTALFTEYFADNMDEIEEVILHAHFQHMLISRRNDVLQGYIDNKQIKSKKAISEMEAILNQIDEENRIIDYSGVDSEVVNEVVNLAIKNLSKVGNFSFRFDYEAYEPNDDLLIDISAPQFDNEIVKELQDGWHKDMIEIESEHSFTDLSRVVISYVTDEELV